MENVAITGIGVVSPMGVGVERHTQGLLDGELRIRHDERYEEELGPSFWAPVTDFDASDWMDEKIIDVLATKADVLAVANPGCQMQLESGLRAKGFPMKVEHVSETLLRAF